VNRAPVKFRDPTGHYGEPFWEKAWNWLVGQYNKVSYGVREWWAYHNPCGMSVDPMCRAFSVSPPSGSDVARQAFGAQNWAGGVDWKQLNEIAEITDQAQRLARLSDVFTYQAGAVEPGSYDFATSTRQEQLDMFVETYFSNFDFGNIEVVYGGDLGAGRYGLFEEGTIIIGEAAFAEGFGQVGITVFHEWLEQHRGELTHEQIYHLEELWQQWYDSQQ